MEEFLHLTTGEIIAKDEGADEISFPKAAGFEAEIYVDETWSKKVYYL